MDGLKLVCHELAKAAGDPDSGALDELANDADLLVTTLFVKVWYLNIEFQSEASFVYGGL